jgi:hypothetical protein
MATVLRDSAARLAAYQRQGTAVLLADLRGLGETTDPATFNDPKYYNQEYRPTQLALHLGRPLLAYFAAGRWPGDAGGLARGAAQPAGGKFIHIECHQPGGRYYR